MKLFVWDLHGTLEKGTEKACLEISNVVLKEQGWKETYSREEINLYYGRQWRNIFKEKIKGEEESYYERLEQRAFQIATENFSIVEKYIQRNDHVIEVLTAIKDKGHKQILLSNVTPENLEKFLDALELKTFFPEGNYFATGNEKGKNPKVTAFQRIIETYTELQDCIFIGDRIEDLEPVWITRGYTFLYSHPEKPFLQCSGMLPDEKITNLRKILEKI